MTLKGAASMPDFVVVARVHITRKTREYRRENECVSGAKRYATKCILSVTYAISGIYLQPLRHMYGKWTVYRTVEIHVRIVNVFPEYHIAPVIVSVNADFKAALWNRYFVCRLVTLRKAFYEYSVKLVYGCHIFWNICFYC